jgi:hypothetical protein
LPFNIPVGTFEASDQNYSNPPSRSSHHLNSYHATLPHLAGMCKHTHSLWPCNHTALTHAEPCGEARSDGLSLLGRKRETATCNHVRVQMAAASLEEDCPAHCLQTPWRCCRCAAAAADPANKQVAWRCRACGHTRCYGFGSKCAGWKGCDCEWCFCGTAVLAGTERCGRCVEKCKLTE